MSASINAFTYDRTACISLLSLSSSVSDLFDLCTGILFFHAQLQT